MKPSRFGIRTSARELASRTASSEPTAKPLSRGGGARDHAGGPAGEAQEVASVRGPAGKAKESASERAWMTGTSSKTFQIEISVLLTLIA